MSGKKIRNLIDVDGRAVTLNDVLADVAACHSPLLDLEYKSKKTQLAEAKKAIRKASNTLQAFRKRLYGEITEDVNFTAKTDNVNYSGDLGRMKKREE